MPALQARYWILTIPENDWELPGQLPDAIGWLFGQREEGAGGYRHWQFVAHFKRKVTMSKAKESFCPTAHLEPCRSEAANSYVRKEETRIADSEFELGEKTVKRNSSNDWEDVWKKAKNGEITDIPADIRVRCYHTLKRICKDHSVAPFRQNVEVNVYYGVTGSGKSHRAFEEAAGHGPYYVKSPTTKWWDGYRGEKNVIIDEFRGVISIEHLLKWLDKYPCRVEEKGGDLPLQATRFWLLSNKEPYNGWYPDVDLETRLALGRRLTNVVKFEQRYQE